MKQLAFKERFKRYIEPIFDSKRNYFIHLVQSIIRSFSTLLHIFFVERIVYSLTISDIELFHKTLMFYVITFLLYELVWFLTRKVGWVINIPSSRYFIFKKYLSKLIKMNSEDYEKIGTGKMISIIDSASLFWSESISQIIEKWAIIVVLFIYTFYKVWSKSITLLWFTIFMIVFSIITMSYVNKLQFRFRDRRTDIKNGFISNIVRIIMSKYEIMQTDKLSHELSKLDKLKSENIHINQDMWTGRFFQNRSVLISISIILIFVSYTYWFKVLDWSILVSEFVAITSLLLVISWSIYSFVQFYIDFTKNFITIEKLWDLFDNVSYIETYDKWEKFIHKWWNIDIKNMSFSYNETEKVFENFDLSIKPWEKIALVWASGSGKTTLVKIISWYIKASSWEVMIDWQNISDLSLKSYFKNVGYLTQEPSIFDWTIYENLSYSVEGELKEEEINKVLKDSCSDFVFSLEKWIHTEIGERWIRLSWWQRQRLAIAKIMLKNPEIIILDEPTSALDSFSEEQITKAMDNLFKDKTVIIIAHRLQTVKKAGTIYVIENWKIMESWTHKTLLENKWIYYDMIELQSWF